jgi:hypothetical protein
MKTKIFIRVNLLGDNTNYRTENEKSIAESKQKVLTFFERDLK